MENPVEQKVKDILVNELGVDADEVKLTAHLFDDLDADSLDAVEFTMALEDDFDIEIPDDDMTQWKTVSDIVDYIEKRRAV
jgi:acyl carrier protein